MNKVISGIIPTAIILVFFCVAISPVIGDDDFPKTIVDSANRTVTIDEPVERIVPMVTWAYEPLYVLGAGDKIVGVSADAKELYPWLEGMESKQVVGTWSEYDYEKVLELEPDIVICSSGFANQIETNNLLPGVTVLVFKFNDPQLFDQELRTLATITDTGDKLDSYLSWRQEVMHQLTGVTDTMKPEDRRQIYCEYSDYPWHPRLKDYSGDYVIRWAGGDNVAADLPFSTPEIDPEWVLMKNPQAILFSASTTFSDVYLTGYYVDSTENATAFLEEVKERVGLMETDAVKNDQLFIVEEMCVDASRNFIGACYLAKWLYPEQFQDLDPEAVHEEYFEEWLGVPYQGVWAYP